MNIDRLEECIMVDTIGLRIHDVDPSRLPQKYSQVGGDDDTKWAKGVVQTAAGKNSLKVKAVKSRRTFNIEGSPAFFRQGHNIVSSGDVTMLAYAAIQDCNRELDLGLELARAREFVRGRGMEVTRIDTPVLLRKPDGLSTAAVINGIAMAGIQAGHSMSLYQKETVYFDQHSQLRSLKGYDKEVEMKGKRRLDIPQIDQHGVLMALAANTIRLEPVYRQKWLSRRQDEGLLTPDQLTPNRLANYFADILDTYNLRWDLRWRVNKDALMAIPRRYRSYVLHWQAGFEMSRLKAENSSEYSRARGYLKKMHSVDIDAPTPQDLEARVELGDILSVENFMPVPPEIRADPQLFFSCNMELERTHLGPRWRRPWKP